MIRRLVDLIPFVEAPEISAADFWRMMGSVQGDEPLTPEEADAIMAADPLEQEFRELEREVLQRECDHGGVRYDIADHGSPGEVMCVRCGKRFTP